MPKVSFQALFRNANPDALDLLDAMLAFDPSRRISVEAALEHPYLQIWHDASDEPICPEPFNFDFEVVDDIGEMKRMILHEVARFRSLVRSQIPAGVQIPGQGQPGVPQSGQVPIPEGVDRSRFEDPRPQEALHGGGVDGLEADLHSGMDAGRMRA